MVDVSWTAKPCGRSSRSMMLRCPPELGAWAWAGAAATSQADPKTSHRAAATWTLVIVFLLFTPVSRDRAHVPGRELIGLPREDPLAQANIREWRDALNPSAAALRDASAVTRPRHAARARWPRARV